MWLHIFLLYVISAISSDTTYEQHMAQHIQKDKWFRCQSCRLVFESENFRQRHELEMHGRQKWSVPEPFPKVPMNVKGFFSYSFQ